MKNNDKLDTGRILSEFLANNKISKTDMGRLIGRNGYSILKYLRSDSMQTKTLLNICMATKHNFFKDIAYMLPNDFKDSGFTDDLINEKDRLIAQLQDENKTLKIQNDVLTKISLRS